MLGAEAPQHAHATHPRLGLSPCNTHPRAATSMFLHNSLEWMKQIHIAIALSRMPVGIRQDPFTMASKLFTLHYIYKGPARRDHSMACL